MGYSKKRLIGSISGSTAAVLLLIVLILTSQVVMAALPVVGIGGVLLQADYFEGNNGVIYPEKGELPDYTGKVTDTASCQERPMVVFQLDGAQVDGYSVFKDVKLPYFEDRWMTIQIDQENGQLLGNQISIYTTQMTADQLTIRNIELYEGESGDVWGPESGEFIMRGDPGDNVDPDLFADNVIAWVHALTGEGVTFSGSSANPIMFNVTFSSTQELENRYQSDEFSTMDESASGEARENYFDCLPGAPATTGSLLDENFEGGSVPSGWDATGDTVVNQDTSNSGDYSARLDGNDDSLSTESIDTSSETEVPITYWVRQGDTFSEPPDRGEYLVVEYLSEEGAWNEVETYEGGEAGRVHDGRLNLPGGALHDDFRLRFRTEGGTDGLDYWHVDDVVIG